MSSGVPKKNGRDPVAYQVADPLHAWSGYRVVVVAKREDGWIVERHGYTMLIDPAKLRRFPGVC